MRFTFAFVASALFGCSIGVDVVVYPNSVTCNGHDGTGLICTNITAYTCCNNRGRDIYSAKRTHLYTSTVPDQCVIATGRGPGVDYCKTALEAYGGTSIVCLEPGSSPAAKGAFWVDLSRSRRVQRGQDVQCTKSVQPDRVLFGTRSFRINYDVPTNITNYLLDLIDTDPSLSHEIPSEVLQYESANSGIGR